MDIEVTCSPERSACFARDICDTEDESCGEEDVPTETSYYKTVERKAYAFPEACASGSLDAPECADLSCRPGETECAETFCSDETVPEGETCVGPGFVPEDPEDATLPDDSSMENGEGGNMSDNSGEVPGGASGEDSNEENSAVQMN